MILNKNSLFSVLAILVFLVLKVVFIYADNNMLQFLTKPTNSLISLIHNSSWVYTNEDGFFHERLNIIIDKSCSGFNFWLICFAVFVFTALKSLSTNTFKALSIPASLIIGYIATVFVNASRISISIFLEAKITTHYSWLHEAEGAFIYVSFLIIFYLLINHLLNLTTRKNEKLA